jgi:hypothetical protein
LRDGEWTVVFVCSLPHPTVLQVDAVRAAAAAAAADARLPAIPNAPDWLNPAFTARVADAAAVHGIIAAAVSVAHGAADGVPPLLPIGGACTASISLDGMAFTPSAAKVVVVGAPVAVALRAAAVVADDGGELLPSGAWAQAPFCIRTQCARTCCRTCSSARPRSLLQSAV